MKDELTKKWRLFMKKQVSIVTVLVLFFVTIFSRCGEISATAYGTKSMIKFDSTILRDVSFTVKQSILSEVERLQKCNIDASLIKKVEIAGSRNEYIMDYDGTEETVIIVKENDEGITLVAEDDQKHNTIVINNNGELIIDGKKIEVTTVGATSKPQKYATIWKSEKSLKPFPPLTSSDYNTLGATGKQNIALGKALNTLTITALGIVISNFHGYAGIAVTLGGVASNVYDVLVNVNPKTEYLGCAYKTFHCGAYDNEYANRFYANKECTGSYRLEWSYERFIVY